MKSPFFSVFGASVLMICSALTTQAAGINGQGSWETTLQARDLDGDPNTAEAYYDTLLDITWLADANYAKTSGYDFDGKMTWDAATNWARTLHFAGGGWRLPTLGPINGTAFDYAIKDDGSSDFGFNITAPGTLYAGSTANEMAHLFYNTLGNAGQYDISGAYLGCTAPDFCLKNTGPFINFQPDFYWAWLGLPLDTEYWEFDFYGGDQGRLSAFSQFYALAVHDGDVGTPIATASLKTEDVPIPTIFIVFMAGAFLLIARRSGFRG